MLPEGDEDADGLTTEQFRWLVGASVVLGLLFLLLIGGITASSHLFGIGGGSEGPPDATFALETEETADGVAASLTHVEGEAANPEDVVIEVDGERIGTWGELGGEGPGLVGPGHTLRIDEVEPGQEVRIYWVGDGERTLLGSGVVAEPSAG